MLHTSIPQVLVYCCLFNKGICLNLSTIHYQPMPSVKPRIQALVQFTVYINYREEIFQIKQLKGYLERLKLHVHNWNMQLKIRDNCRCQNLDFQDVQHLCDIYTRKEISTKINVGKIYYPLAHWQPPRQSSYAIFWEQHYIC